MSGSGVDVRARVLVDGEARAPALVLDEPLSFWGGVDPTTGRIIDRHHPQQDVVVSGRILCLPAGRGSSSSSSVIAESIRAGTAPAGIVLREPDPIIALGALVAAELYGSAPPVIVADASAYAAIRTGDRITLERGGRLIVAPAARGQPSG